MPWGSTAPLNTVDHAGGPASGRFTGDPGSGENAEIRTQRCGRSRTGGPAAGDCDTPGGRTRRAGLVAACAALASRWARGTLMYRTLMEQVRIHGVGGAQWPPSRREAPPGTPDLNGSGAFVSGSDCILQKWAILPVALGAAAPHCVRAAVRGEPDGVVGTLPADQL